MTLETVNRWRSWLGKAAAICFILFLASAADGLVLRIREPENLFRLIPGGSVKINGPVREGIKDVGELTTTSDSPKLQLSFEAIAPGFWLGGTLWRGILTAQPGIAPGEYRLIVHLRQDSPNTKGLPTYRINVYMDQMALQRSSPSLIMRMFGFSPWLLLAVFLPLTVVLTCLVFLLSHKRDKLLEDEGKAEIYWLASKDEMWLVAFGLGTRHGVQVGDYLWLTNEEGEPLGKIKVHAVFESDSQAQVPLEWKVKRGHIVALRR